MDVDVDNVGPLINRLSRFDKDVYKILQREIKDAAEIVAADARRRVPETALSRWGPWNQTTGSNASIGVVRLATGNRDLGFESSRVRRGVKPSVRKTRARGRGTTGISGRVTMGDAGGAIWSLAGSRNLSGSRFNQALNNRFGASQWPRALTPALYDKAPEAMRRIDAAIQRAADAVT